MYVCMYVLCSIGRCIRLEHVLHCDDLEIGEQRRGGDTANVGYVCNTRRHISGTDDLHCDNPRARLIS